MCCMSIRKINVPKKLVKTRKEMHYHMTLASNDAEDVSTFKLRPLVVATWKLIAQMMTGAQDKVSCLTIHIK